MFLLCSVSALLVLVRRCARRSLLLRCRPLLLAGSFCLLPLPRHSSLRVCSSSVALPSPALLLVASCRLFFFSFPFLFRPPVPFSSLPSIFLFLISYLIV